VRSGGSWILQLQDTGWMPLALQNGFTDASSSAAPAGYRIINGSLRLRGEVIGGASATVVFKLPFGPGSRAAIPISIAGGSGDVGKIVVAPDGTATFYGVVHASSPGYTLHPVDYLIN